MALKAGYVGVKKNDAFKLSQLPGITEIGTGLELEDGELSATGATKTIEGNPEGSATETLTKLQIGDDIFSIPGNDNSKCYQTDDVTESAIVDADYIPFLDSSAASGAGAPRKSTWSNFKAKLKAYFDEVYQTLLTPGEGITITSSTISIKGEALDSSDDLNDITETGIYSYVSQPTNAPAGVGVLLVKRLSTDDLIQIVHSAYSDRGEIYVRRYSSNTWRSWYKFSGTVVTP